MNLYLIGMPGCGKSTLAHEISKSTGLKKIDLDEEIVKAEGTTIEEIFNSKGENYFRQLEKATLEKFSTQSGLLVATGGGAPCFFDNVDTMNRTGVTVFIDVPAGALVKRLTASTGTVRPMVKNKSEEEIFAFVSQKLQERLPFYSKAKITVSGGNIKSKDILNKLQELDFRF